MKRTFATAFTLPAAFLAHIAGAANIYMLSAGIPVQDQTIAAALTAQGHTVTIGADYTSFNGTVNLTGFDTVYIQCNANWTNSNPMPVAGQQQLIAWVNSGGRLVTSEWVIYYTSAGSKFDVVASIIPAEWSINYGTVLQATYTVATADPAINAGLPAAFEFPLDSYTGTETFTSAKSGATTYYTTNNSPDAVGLCGWSIGTGSVFSFTSTCGPDQVLDVEFGRLFANVMGAHASAACYANCDNSTATPVLSANDFVCFLNRFVAGESYADCDHVGGLTANDFPCFLNAFVAGCP
jgi:hypothetical protein